MQLQFVMNSFVFGLELELGLDLKRLDPPPDDDIWELRSYVEPPFLRVFGSFVLPRYFLAVAHRVRSDLEAKRGGPKWKRLLREVVDSRDRLLNGELHFSAHSAKQHF